MDDSCPVNCVEEDVANEVGMLPTGKSSYGSISHNGIDNDQSDEVELELESARLEIEVAEAMKRAAEAQRRAAEAARRKARGLTPGVVGLDDGVFTRLPVAGVKQEMQRIETETKMQVDGGVSVVGHVENETDRLSRLLSSLELSKCELPPFDGSPLQYVPFFRQFEELVEGRVKEESRLLSYLNRYCQGAAKNAIQGCLLFPGQNGYTRARKILLERFGQPHMIARAMINAVTKPGQIPPEVDDLTVYADTLVSCVDALEQLNYLADINATSTLEKVLNKLPRFITGGWVEHSQTIYRRGREPRFRDLCEFIFDKVQLQRNHYSYLLRDRKPRTEVAANDRAVNGRRFNVAAFKTTSCYKCRLDHPVETCKEFLSLNIQDRWALVSNNKLCFVCLRQGHRSATCQSRQRCTENGCKGVHHPLLHRSEVRPILNASCQVVASDRHVVLGVIPILIEGPNGSCHATALLDSGADTSLIRKDLVQKLGLEGSEQIMRVNTPMGSVDKRCTKLSFSIRSLEGGEATDISNAYTVDSVLDMEAVVPERKTLAKWSHLDDITFKPLASPVIGVLLGVDVPEVHWVLEQRRGKKGDPYADRTPFGWVLRGPINRSSTNGARVCAVQCGLQALEDNFRRLYDADFGDVRPFETAPSVEEETAMDMAERSVELVNGHLCLGLPWKDDQLKKVCNRSAAMHRLEHLSKRLRANPIMKEAYSAVIDRYIQRGYAIPVDPKGEDRARVKWYLPHHAVLNPKKPEKVRVVFDGAASFKGESLNGHLLSGPNLLSSLVGILLRFRSKPIALSADIEDMFLQVGVAETDQDALRFLWWSDGDPELPALDFKLTVHPFGAISSPFCANFALKKAATMFGHDVSADVSHAVLESFYVDDLLMSVERETDAIDLVKGLTNLLGRVGFRLTKWSSNRREVLQAIPPEDICNAIRDLDTQQLPTQRTLGISWDMQTDSFKYKLRMEETCLTRRSILSLIASVYDPLGWISLYLLPAKQFLQHLCKKGVGWDELLDKADEDRWERCRQAMLETERVNIPRWYGRDVHDQCSDIELHVFCDASEEGYGAVVYLRFVGETCPSKCVLTLAKARVAPLKVVTIPRLELTAAVLAVEMASTVTREINVTLQTISFWTDSLIVLYYLRNEKDRFATFVANRIRRIKEGSSPAQWRHVPGKDNPADLASRGTSSREGEILLWMNGPAFLREPGKIVTAEVKENHNLDSASIEWKNKVCVASLTNKPGWGYFLRFSSWFALLRWTAWMLRFKQYLVLRWKGQSGMCLRLGSLTMRDISESRQAVIRLLQAECFPEEVSTLSGGQDNRKGTMTHSTIRKLYPILKNGLLCVGGRLQYSDLSESAKHPIILPPKHHVTSLIIKHYHEMEGHVGYMHVSAVIRKMFWIVQGRAAVRRVIGMCWQCKRDTIRPGCQLMAPLPIERVTHGGHAFAHVGVDFFGPLYVKQGRSEHKRYGCLFTCLNIRAVHIEVTHSLSSDSFIQALTRFMARRGKPSVMFSDNGSNFKGAYNELRACREMITETRTQNFILEREIDWQFGPPEASHWGGVWERMIRSVRRILQAITRGQRNTDETLLTFLSEVERIINDRPLVPVSEDVRDPDALTPNRLLLLRDSKTPMDECTFNTYCVRSWRRVQLLASTFWKRWKTEYVCMLQERTKWFRQRRDLKVGDLVLVVDEKVDRNQWPLGIVCEAFPGSDGLVRESLVRTSRNVLRRDVRKLCLLEGAHN